MSLRMISSYLKMKCELDNKKTKMPVRFVNAGILFV